MNILEVSGKLKKITSSIVKNHRESMKILLRDNFNKDSFTKLFKGELVISRELIRSNIKKVLDKDASADLSYIACTDKGVRVGVSVNKFKIHILAEIGLLIKKAVITPKNQKIIIQITKENIAGNNLSGKLLSIVAGTIISSFIKKSILSLDLPIYYSKKNNFAVLELHKMPALRRMKKPILGKKSILDFISIAGIAHTDNGITLKSRVKVL